MPPDGCVVAFVAFAVLAVPLAVSLAPVPPLIEPQLALSFLSSSSSRPLRLVAVCSSQRSLSLSPLALSSQPHLTVYC